MTQIITPHGKLVDVRHEVDTMSELPGFLEQLMAEGLRNDLVINEQERQAQRERLLELLGPE